MINQLYVDWLVGWIKNGTINIKTKQPFKLDDIKVQEYTGAVVAEFKQEVVDGRITEEQYKQYTGQDYIVQ